MNLRSNLILQQYSDGKGRHFNFLLNIVCLPSSFTLLIPIFIFLTFFNIRNAKAQVSGGRSLYYSQQFRLASGIVRIAEPGQISDTVNVWGDINNPGRYMVPVGTTLPELISYARGPLQYRTGQTTINWSRLRIEVHVSHPLKNKKKNKVTNFTYRYYDPVPEKMQNFILHNNDVVSLQVKARPSIVNYLQIIAPVITSVATSLLIIQRIK